MRTKLAGWAALIAAIAVFGLAFWVLGQGVLALVIAVLSFAGTAFGVYRMMDSRSTAQVEAAEFSEATEREVAAVRQAVGTIQQLSGRIQNAAVRQVLRTGSQDVLVLLDMVRSRQPDNLFLSANSLVASAGSLAEAVRGYLAIQDNTRLSRQDRAEPLSQGAQAFQAFADDVRTRLRLVDIGDIAEYLAQLKRRAEADPDLPMP